MSHKRLAVLLLQFSLVMITAECLAKELLEMLTEHKSKARASLVYKIKDSALSRWKHESNERSPTLFERVADQRDEQEERISELERMFGGWPQS